MPIQEHPDAHRTCVGGVREAFAVDRPGMIISLGHPGSAIEVRCLTRTVA
jgi:hypothetical protein